MSHTVISTGVTSTGLTFDTGNSVTVFGTVSGTTLSGGTESVSSGGRAYKTTVSSGGSEYVFTDGTASFTTVSSAGFEYVSGGATVSVLLAYGGYATVYSGGT